MKKVRDDPVTYIDVLGERYDIGRTAQNAQSDENRS